MGDTFHIAMCAGICHSVYGVEGSRYGGCLPDRDTLDRDPSPRTVNSGRYASYWNAFLLQIVLTI